VASILNATNVKVGVDGSLYIREEFFVRRVGTDGIITTVAGVGTCSLGACPTGDGGPPTQASFGPAVGVALGPDGTLYIADSSVPVSSHRVRKVVPIFPRALVDETLIAAEDGSEVYHFDPRGRHLDTREPLTGAFRYQFTYDSAGRLAQVVDANNNITLVQRDSSGNPTAILGPFGQSTTFSQDSNGFLATISDPASNTNNFSYTPDGLLFKRINPNGKEYDYTYESALGPGLGALGTIQKGGRLNRDADPAGGFKTLARTDTDRSFTVTVTTALNRAWAYLVDSLTTGDQRRTITYPTGLSTQTAIGKDASSTVAFPSGMSLTQTKGPDPRFGMTEPLFNTSSLTTPGGLSATTTLSRTTSLANPNDPFSLTSQTDTFTVNGRTYTATYSAATKMITATTPLGRQTLTTLDDRGRVVQISRPGVLPTSLHYETAHGRIDTVTQGTRTFRFGYNDQGTDQANVARVTDPLSNPPTLIHYDLAGRPNTITRSDSRTIGIGFDQNGNLTTLTPPGRPAHVFSYWPVDLEKDYTPPDVGQPRTTHRDYNVDRQVINISRPDGDNITPGYDLTKGRLISLTTSRGAIGVGYDSMTGLLSSITTPDNIGLAYGYDGLLLKDITWSGPIAGNVHKEYDSSFRLTSERVNSGAIISFGYDNDHLLTSAGALTIARDAASGFVTGTALGNLTDVRTYNGYGEQASYTASYQSNTLYTVTYDTSSAPRDGLGRIVARTERVGTEPSHTFAYQYDNVGHLTDVTKDGTLISHYEYDANGNRLVGPGLTASPLYDNQDRLTTYGNCTYSYKSDGSLQTKTCGTSVTVYDYDALGNLRNVLMPNGTHIEYLIDGQNRRVGKRVCATPIGVSCPASSLSDGFLYRTHLKPAAWLNADGSVKATFVYGLQRNVPEYMVKGGVTYRVITDQLGSVRLIVDSNGNVAERIDYDEFGNVVSDTAPGFQPFGFAGGLRDIDTGLVRFGARDYDSVSGRWTNKDPVNFAGGLANLYSYVGSDPLNWIDPTGWWDVFVFGSYSASAVTPIRPAVLGEAKVGYSSTEGWYLGNVLARGIEIGSHENYFGYFEGLESTTSCPNPEKITLTEVSFGAEIPFLAGSGFGEGFYRTDNEQGLFFFLSGGAIGQEGAVGFGFSTPSSQSPYTAEEGEIMARHDLSFLLDVDIR
jgi:RHS repeat-associated protein